MEGLISTVFPRNSNLTSKCKIHSGKRYIPQIKTYSKWNLPFLESSLVIMDLISTSDIFFKIFFQPHYNTLAERSSSKYCIYIHRVILVALLGWCHWCLFNESPLIQLNTANPKVNWINWSLSVGH